MPTQNEIIDAAVDAAVKKTFAILGVDVEKPESVEEFREDLRFGKSMRKYASHGFMAFVTVVISGFAVAAWYGIIDRIHRS